jgi:hypothetical protein
MAPRQKRPGSLSDVWDPDLTPPPIALPDLEGLTSEEQVEALKECLDSQHGSIVRLWGLRKVDDQIETLVRQSTEMSTLMREFMMPAVKDLMGRMDGMEQANVASTTKWTHFWDNEWPHLTNAVNQISSHFSRIEKDVDRIERQVDEFVRRFDDVRTTTNRRLDELKSRNEQLELRIRKVEDFKTSMTAKIAALYAVLVIGITLLEHFLKR